MELSLVIAPITFLVAISLGTWRKWRLLSIYGRDNRKEYIMKIIGVGIIMVAYPMIAAEYDVRSPFDNLIFWWGVGFFSAVIYISMIRRAEDIIHFSLAQKIILFIIVPIFGSYIEIINVITYLAVPALMIWPGRKDEVTHVDRQS